MCLFTNAVFVLHPGQILTRSGCNATPPSPALAVGLGSPIQKFYFILNFFFAKRLIFHKINILVTINGLFKNFVAVNSRNCSCQSCKNILGQGLSYISKYMLFMGASFTQQQLIFVATKIDFISHSWKYIGPNLILAHNFVLFKN